MVHLLVLVYGKPERNDREIRRLEEWLDREDAGMIREYRFIDCVMKEERMEDFKEQLSYPHPHITHATKKLRIFLKLLEYKTVEDDRKLIRVVSPNMNIIGVKEDRRRPDGREVL